MDKLTNEITIIIVTYLSSKVIENCLNKINKQYNVLVVENSNNINFKKFIEQKYSNVECLLSGGNLGYGAANNIGIMHSKSKYVFILNPDVEIEKNTLENLEKKINEKKNFALLLPRLSNSDMDEFFIKKNSEDFKVNYKCIGKNIASGCAMLLNKDVIKNIGFFDEKIFIYKEETDLIKRCTDNNLDVYSVPTCKVKHFGSSSHNPEVKFQMDLSRNWHWMWSNYYFYKKNFGIFYAYRKTFRKLFSSFLKMFFYLIVKNEKKHLIYKSRFYGLLNSYLNRPSSYRPKISN